MILLALDTATRHTAAALLSGDRPLAAACEPASSHSKSLLPLIERLLAEAGLGRERIEAVGVGLGPGSFTGVRIGLTVAKTLAFAGSLPLVGISSLRTLAENGRDLGEQVCPALDALKGEVFAARYGRQVDRGRPLDEVAPPAAWDPRGWAEALAAGEGQRVLLGSGLLRYRELFAEVLGERLVVPAGAESHLVSAVALGRLASAAIERGERHDPASLEPLYCRPSEAELHRLSRPVS